MDWLISFILTLAVVVYVGYPLFQRSAVPEDSLERAVAKRRSDRTRKVRQDAKVSCVACGRANEPGDKFCDRCGAALARACPDCGAEFDPGDRFCAACGAGLVGGKR